MHLFFSNLDVHPDSVCEKLGPKYASVPVPDLTNRVEFFDDLLRYNLFGLLIMYCYEFLIFIEVSKCNFNLLSLMQEGHSYDCQVGC